MISEIIGSAVQLVLFGIVPFTWWLLTARKKEGFFKWLGIKRIKNIKEVIFPTLITIVGFMLMGYFTLYLIRDVETATTSYAGLGIAGVPIVIVYALVHTSLSEELLFRGFLLKRIGNKFGFITGNLLQAILFGLLHGIMFIGYAGIVKAIIIILFTGTLAFAMGYINEKKADGSILPSWSIHFISNLFSGILSLFSIL